MKQAGITHLVSIGGDDTAFSAYTVSKHARKMGLDLKSVHVPKTIDNDLPLPEGIPTFGYETARQEGANIVANMMEDALSTVRWYIIVAMGRKAGHLAMGIGKSAGATLTLIPEEWQGKPTRLQEVADIIAGLDRQAAGRRQGLWRGADRRGHHRVDGPRGPRISGNGRKGRARPPAPGRDQFGGDHQAQGARDAGRAWASR